MIFRVRLKSFFKQRRRAQSFVELALILPVLLLMVLGVVEVAFFIGRYLDALDLTREAARFASVRDPFSGMAGDQNCNTPDLFDYYYDTACVFSPPAGSDNCTDPNFCNGMNPYVYLNTATDDVVITVFTVTDSAVSNTWPAPDGYWALSDHDTDTTNDGNWQKNCQGEISATPLRLTSNDIDDHLSSAAPKGEGYVAIEFYYCHAQALNLPVITSIIPNPMRIHAYTIMSMPAGAPTATPRP